MATNRHQLARLGAPAAFLLGITVAVLLVRAGLEGGAATARTTTLGPVTHAPTRTIQTIAATAPVPHGTVSTTATATTATATSTATTAAATTAAATTAAGTTSVAGAQYYTVAKGDTFNKISVKTGTSVAELETLNPGVSSSALQVGQRLRIK